MKCLNKNSLFLSIALLTTAGSLFASEVSDTREALEVSTRDVLKSEQLPGQAKVNPVISNAAAKVVTKSGSLLAPIGGSTLAEVPAKELQQYITPTMKADAQFLNFLKKERDFWTEKKAFMEKDPQLKELAKRYLILKQEMLKLKNKGSDYKNFFEKQHEYWINKMAAELK